MKINVVIALTIEEAREIITQHFMTILKSHNLHGLVMNGFCSQMPHVAKMEDQHIVEFFDKNPELVLDIARRMNANMVVLKDDNWKKSCLRVLFDLDDMEEKDCWPVFCQRWK